MYDKHFVYVILVKVKILVDKDSKSDCGTKGCPQQQHSTSSKPEALNQNILLTTLHLERTYVVYPRYAGYRITDQFWHKRVTVRIGENEEKHC